MKRKEKLMYDNIGLVSQRPNKLSKYWGVSSESGHPAFTIKYNFGGITRQLFKHESNKIFYSSNEALCGIFAAAVYYIVNNYLNNKTLEQITHCVFCISHKKMKRLYYIYVGTHHRPTLVISKRKPITKSRYIYIDESILQVYFDTKSELDFSEVPTKPTPETKPTPVKKSNMTVHNLTQQEKDIAKQLFELHIDDQLSPGMYKFLKILLDKN